MGKIHTVLAALVLLITVPGASGGLIAAGRRLLQASSRCRIDNCNKITCRPFGSDPVCDGPGHKPQRFPPSPPNPSAPQWPPAPAAPAWPPQPRPEAGCFGELPFGLEFCVCDGAEIGEAAGIAACAAVSSTCNSFVSFTSLEEVQQICDQHAIDACRSASLMALENQPECKKLVLHGGSSCSAQEAQDLFEAAVAHSCEPLCPDCVRKQEDDFTGRPDELPEKPVKPDLSLSCTEEREFDLHHCVCEGDTIGLDVGRSACQVVKRECPRTRRGALSSFTIGQPTQAELEAQLIEVKQVCDDLQQQACVRTAGDAVGSDPECADILIRGNEAEFNYKCTVEEAMHWFQGAIEFGCTPVSSGFP